MSVDPGSRGWNEHRHMPVSIPNSQLAADAARANQLVNGGFENWQRGNGPFTAGSAYGPDRWQLFPFAGTLSVSKDTTNTDTGSSACAAATNTNVVVGSCYLEQKLVFADGAQVRGRTISVSVRARTATANAVRIGVNSDGTGGGITYSAYHTGGSAYQTLTATYTVPADATYALVRIYFDAACTAYLDNAMLVVGPVAADYVPLPPADDLARCLRYYELLGGTAWNKFGAGVCFSTAQANAHVPFRVQKTVTPSVTLSAAASFAVGVTSNIVATAVTTDIVTPTALSITATVAAGLTGGWGALLEDNGGGGTRASIALEANP